MKAKREQVDDKLMVMKMFSCNYARDLMIIFAQNFLKCILKKVTILKFDLQKLCI
jgi:hypothetical protein